MIKLPYPAFGPGGALGLFGFESRATCLIRVRRLLDAERPTRTSPRLWPIYGLILLALFSLASLRASGQAPTNPPQDPIKAAIPKAAEGLKTFELHVVGPDGKPVPEALVHFRTEPAPTAEQVRLGKFIRKTTYGTYARTNPEGNLILELANTSPTSFDLDITTPGYGPYWASWSSETHQEAIPPRFTAELEAGWSVGGLIVDEAGKPIQGAKVQPHIEFKKRPGDLRQLASGTTLTTDAAGKWRFDSVPASMGMVGVSINHADFQPIQRPISRGEFGIEPGREQTGKIVLSRGLTVVGKVTDEAGKPIAGALIRTKFMNDIREAKTGDDGTYRLVGCEARSTRVVVSAKGRATDMKELVIEPGMGPLDFQMKPGKTVRIRVLDDQGNPAPEARIFFQRWRGRFQYFEFNHVTQYAGKDGTWVWAEAPLDEFSADICPPGQDGMQLVLQPLIAREEEYVFRLPAALVVSGKAIDGVTKEPIKEFRVVPGSRSDTFWNQRQEFKVKDGRYQIRQTRVEDEMLLRIEADGYEPAVSRAIKNTEGKVTVDFELKRGKNILGMVLTRPGLQPAKGAVVALGIAGSQIIIKNGEFDNGLTFCERTTTDEEGRFHFAAQDKDFVLVITHPTGYAQINGSPDWNSMQIIRLTPWAKVEGTFRIGSKPTPGVPIGITVSSHERNAGARINTQHETSSGLDGKYLFDRVIPGRGSIGRELFLTVDDGASEATSSCKVAAEFPAGKTTHLDLGGTGRAVVGKLQPPEDADKKFRWNFALVNVLPVANDPPTTGPYLTATVDRDGSFRIDDAPEGRYTLSVSWMNGIAGTLANHRFEVPAVEAGRDEKPIDLGTLKLQARVR
jgi:Carboxypeptidase regulatory-like domain